MKNNSLGVDTKLGVRPVCVSGVLSLCPNHIMYAGMAGWSISLPKQFGMTQLVGGKMWRKSPKLSLMLLNSCLL